MSRLTDWLDARQINVIWNGFPTRYASVCANRRTKRYWALNIELMLQMRDVSKPDGYSEEEMIRFMDIYAGRQLNGEEIRQIQMLKSSGHEPFTVTQLREAIEKGIKDYWHEAGTVTGLATTDTVDYMMRYLVPLVNARPI